MPNGVVPVGAEAAEVDHSGSDGRPYPSLVAVADAGASPLDCLAFGDSVMERVSKHDTDRRTLSEMLRDRLAPSHVVTVTASAYNPIIFEPLLKVAQSRPYHPKVIVLPINMRCFSAQWDLHPQWQFEREQRVIQKYLRSGRIGAIRDVVKTKKAMRRYEETAINCPLSQYKTIGEFNRVIRSKPTNEDERRARLRDIFILHHGSVLTADHRKVKALASAASIARRFCPRVLAYVTPINIEAAVRYGGRELADIIAQNIALISTVGGIVDWSRAVRDEHFFHRDDTTEHLNETGRRMLTELIATHIGR